MGPYDRTFDFNRDGRMNAAESAAAYDFEMEMERKSRGYYDFDEGDEDDEDDEDEDDEGDEDDEDRDFDE